MAMAQGYLKKPIKKHVKWQPAHMLLCLVFFFFVNLVFLFWSFRDPQIDARYSASDSTLGKQEMNSSIKLHGFHYCHHLDGSEFKSHVVLIPLQKTLYSLLKRADQEAMKLIVNVIDQEAIRLYTLFMSLYPSALTRDAKRYACYSAGQGATQFANITSSQLLTHVHGPTYFKEWLSIPSPHFPFSTRTYSNSQFYPALPQPKRVYKLAYFIMFHDPKSFDNLKNMIQVLDDEMAIILIHIDKKSQAFASKIQDYVLSRHFARANKQVYANVNTYRQAVMQGRVDLSDLGNVFILEENNNNIYGHVSMVYTELQGFWALQELADWEYVINLSCFDFPLKRNQVIYNTLDRPEYRGKSWVKSWMDSYALSLRLTRPYLGKSDYSSSEHVNDMGLHMWPFGANWKPYKQHQWMILAQDFVQELKTHQPALDTLAFMEHRWIPDESFFSTVILNDDKLKQRWVDATKTYVRFPRGSSSTHPSWLYYHDRHYFPASLFPNNPDYFFIRKVDTGREPDLLDWIYKNHLDPQAVPTQLQECTPDLYPTSHCIYNYAIEMDSSYPQFKPTSSIFKHISDAYPMHSKSPRREQGNPHVIVIPVNRAMRRIADNLLCSLAMQHIYNVIIWALDSETHDLALSRGFYSLFLAETELGTRQYYYGNWELTIAMKAKVKLIDMILSSGVDVWFLDSDVVVTRDIRLLLDPYPDIHIFPMIDEKRLVQDHMIEKGLIPNAGAGVVYYKSHPQTIKFIQQWQSLIQSTPGKDDQVLFSELIHDSDKVWVYTPSSYEEDKSRDWIKQTNTHTHVMFLQQSQCINGHLYYGNPRLIAHIPSSQYYLIHANGVMDKQYGMKDRHAWVLNKDGKCTSKAIRLDD